jgi:hypothetical protein
MAATMADGIASYASKETIKQELIRLQRTHQQTLSDKRLLEVQLHERNVLVTKLQHNAQEYEVQHVAGKRQLEGVITDVTARHNAMVTVNSQLQSDKAQLEQQVHTLQQHLEASQKTASDANERVRSMQERVDAAGLESQRHGSEAKHATDQLDVATHNLRVLEKQLEQLIKQKTHAELDHNEIKRKMQLAVGDRAVAQSDQHAIRDELGVALQHVAKLSAENKALEKRLERTVAKKEQFLEAKTLLLNKFNRAQAALHTCKQELSRALQQRLDREAQFAAAHRRLKSDYSSEIEMLRAETEARNLNVLANATQDVEIAQLHVHIANVETELNLFRAQEQRMDERERELANLIRELSTNLQQPSGGGGASSSPHKRRSNSSNSRSSSNHNSAAARRRLASPPPQTQSSKAVVSMASPPSTHQHHHHHRRYDQKQENGDDDDADNDEIFTQSPHALMSTAALRAESHQRSLVSGLAAHNLQVGWKLAPPSKSMHRQTRRDNHAAAAAARLSTIPQQQQKQKPKQRSDDQWWQNIDSKATFYVSQPRPQSSLLKRHNRPEFEYRAAYSSSGSGGGSNNSNATASAQRRQPSGGRRLRSSHGRLQSVRRSRPASSSSSSGV